MKQNLVIRAASLVALALGFLATATGPAWAREKREPIEKFRARAFDHPRGRTSNLDIVIYEWTTPEERQALLETFVEKGSSEALYDALGEVSVKGYLRLQETAPARARSASFADYDMMYAWSVEIDGQRRIVLATDRPLGFLEVMSGFRSRDYNVSLVILELDAETNKGQGIAKGGAELSINNETKRLEIEFRGTQSSKVTNVTPQPVKKKKKKG